MYLPLMELFSNLLIHALPLSGNGVIILRLCFLSA